MNYSNDEEFNIAERPLTQQELNKFQLIEKVLPADKLSILLTHQAEMEKKGVIKPHYKSTKQTVTLHLPLDVVEKFKSTGKNWQAKMNEVLRQYSVNL